MKYPYHFLNLFQDDTLALQREIRKVEWEKFTNDISASCSIIDSTIEEKEKQLKEFYSDLENKLVIPRL